MLAFIKDINLYIPILLCIYYVWNYTKHSKNGVDFFSYFLILIIPMMYMNISIPIYYNLVNIVIVVVVIKGLLDFFTDRSSILISNPIKWFSFFLFIIFILGLIGGVDKEFISGIRNMACFSLSTLFAYKNICKNPNLIFKPMRVNLVITACLSILEVIIYYLNYKSFIIRPMGFAHNANYNCFFILYMLLFVKYVVKERKLCGTEIMALLAALTTQSSAGLVGIVLYLIGNGKLGKRVVKCVIYLALVIVLILVVIRLENYDLYLRLFPSQGDRMVLWSVWIKAFKDHPFIGFGYNKFSIRYRGYMVGELAVSEKAVKALQIYTGGDPNYSIPERLASHNDWIKLLTETGIIGISLFGVFLVKAMKEASKLNVIILKMVAVTIIFFLTNNPLNTELFYIGLFSVVLLERQGIKNGTRIVWRK